MGHAFGLSSATASGPRTAAMCGRCRIDSHVAFMVRVLAAALDANIAVPPRLALPQWQVAAFAAVIVAMIAAIVVRFARAK